MAKKNPSTRWFFNDWHNDDALQICSLAARGAWIELLTICAENNGYILVHDRRPSIAALSRYVGTTPPVMGRLLKELEKNGVFSRNEDGVIFNRRMTRAHMTRAHAHVLPLLSNLHTPLNPPSPPGEGGLQHNRNRKRKKNGAAPPEASPQRGPDYGPSGANGVSWEAAVDDWFRAKAEQRRPFWHQMWTSPPPDQPGCEAPIEIIQSAQKRWLVENAL